MNASETDLPALLFFFVLQEMALDFESVNYILNCDHSIESY